MISLDKDTIEILGVMFKNENLLKYMIYAPANASDNVLAKPLPNKTIQEIFNEYYLSDNPSFINAPKQQSTNVIEKPLICFYPGSVGLQNQIDDSDYYFDIFVPLKWHKLDNRCYKIARVILEIFKNSRVFGEVGKANAKRLIPIASVEGYIGYRIIFRNYNFVWN